MRSGTRSNVYGGRAHGRSGRLVAEKVAAATATSSHPPESGSLIGTSSSTRPSVTGSAPASSTPPGSIGEPIIPAC